MNIKELSQQCINALYVAKAVLIEFGKKGRDLDRESEIKAIKGEVVTKGDNEVSRKLESFLKKAIPEAIIQSEEKGVIARPNNPLYLVTFDEIDGTFNYQRDIFHYCAVITAIPYSDRLKFDDVLFGGVLEHTTYKLWYAIKGKGCFERNLNSIDKKVSVSGRKSLSGKPPASLAIDEGPNVEEERQKLYLKIISESWVRNESCAAYHLANVANGGFDAFLCSIQKAHELGAGYRLIKEAGGVVLDFDGKPIGEQIYNFDSKYGIVAAATSELANELIGKLKR